MKGIPGDADDLLLLAGPMSSRSGMPVLAPLSGRALAFRRGRADDCSALVLRWEG